jgi:8-oxo-dGTP pyrophosphatase MutT (NUDIX family)
MRAEPARRIRRAARLLVEASDGTVLLFRFTPSDRPPLWATPGGECDPDEDYPATAHRELREETGLALNPGPVIAERLNNFITFHGEPVTAHEAWFHVRVVERAIDTAGHTEHELQVMQSHRWFTRAELADWPETIYPMDILSLLPPESAP